LLPHLDKPPWTCFSGQTIGFCFFPGAFPHYFSPGFLSSPCWCSKHGFLPWADFPGKRRLATQSPFAANLATGTLPYRFGRCGCLSGGGPGFPIPSFSVGLGTLAPPALMVPPHPRPGLPVLLFPPCPGVPFPIGFFLCPGPDTHSTQVSYSVFFPSRFGRQRFCFSTPFSPAASASHLMRWGPAYPPDTTTPAPPAPPPPPTSPPDKGCSLPAPPAPTSPYFSPPPLSFFTHLLIFPFPLPSSPFSLPW